MVFGELLLLAVGLSMDAFAVSVCKGLSSGGGRASLLCGLWFGGFQALMPLMGYCLGGMFTGIVGACGDWIAFTLLVLIGANMLREALNEKEESCSGDFSPASMSLLALATSIDALAVGVSLAMAGDVNIFWAAPLIGITTFVLSALGVTIGAVFGSRYEKKAQISGGIILILLGVRILLDHFGIL